MFAEIGAESSFSTGDTTFYTDGAKNTVCSTSNGHLVCYTGAQPLNGVLSLISPAKASNSIRSVIAATTQVKYSKEPHGVGCVSYSVEDQPVTYCINNQGIISYINTATGTFKLTAYTTNVALSQVSVPAGAVMEPEPATP